MIFVIGAVLVGGIAFWLMNCSFNCQYNDWRDVALMIVAILLPLAISTGLIFLNWHMCSKDEIVERIDIYAGYNENEISGSWFLLGGWIDEEDVVYYWVDDNGVKSKHNQPMDDSVFIEDGGEYLLLRQKTCPENLRWLFICGEVAAEFHVPENSIRQMYQYQ